MGAVAPSAVLIDLDGTTWDSDPWYAAIVPPRAGDLRPVAVRFRDSGITHAKFAKVARQHIEQLELQGQVVEVLTELHSAGVPVGAVTNLPGWITNPMLSASALGGLLDVTITYGDTRAHKPNPEPLLLGLRRLGVEPTSDAWYVGDTKGDATAARRAGISFAFASYAAVGPLEGIDPDMELTGGFAPLRDLL